MNIYILYTYPQYIKSYVYQQGNFFHLHSHWVYSLKRRHFLCFCGHKFILFSNSHSWSHSNSHPENFSTSRVIKCDFCLCILNAICLDVRAFDHFSVYKLSPTQVLPLCQRDRSSIQELTIRAQLPYKSSQVISSLSTVYQEDNGL